MAAPKTEDYVFARLYATPEIREWLELQRRRAHQKLLDRSQDRETEHEQVIAYRCWNAFCARFDLAYKKISEGTD